MSAGMNSGSSQSTSTPENLQLPSFTNLAPNIAGGLQQLFQMGPSGMGAFSPFMVNGNPSNGANNPLVAPVTGNQSSLLQGLMGAANPAQNGMNNAMSTVQGFENPNFAANLATSPQTKAAIGSALQPIQQQFSSQVMPGLVSGATAAGQRTNAGAGGQGSSAFNQAFSTAKGSELATEAATSGNIANSAYQTGLNINANAPAMAGTLSSEQISNMINTLNSEALPQLTQQMGISTGLQLYQTQIAQLMEALGLGGQVAQPAIAYNGQSSGSSFGANFGLPLIGH